MHRATRALRHGVRRLLLVLLRLLSQLSQHSTPSCPLALQAGADPSAQDEHGHTPARVAGMHGHRAVVELLLRRAGASAGAGGGSAAAGTAEASPSGGSSIDAYMQSSKEDLKDREAKVGGVC